MINNREDKIIVLFLDSIGLNRGGLTKAIYDRAILYLENNYNVILVSFTNDPESLINIGLIKSKYGMDKLIYINLFHTVLGTYFSDKKHISSDASGYDVEEVGIHVAKEFNRKDGSTTLRFFDNGRFTKLKKLDKTNKLQYIDYHDAELPHRIHRKEIYNKLGYKSEDIYYSHDFKQKYKIYYDSTGYAYLSSWINDSNDMYRIGLHHVDGQTLIFSNIFELQKYLLSEFFSNSDLLKNKEIYVFADEPMTVKFLPYISNNNGNIKKYAVIHANYNLIDDNLKKTGIKSWVTYYNKPDVIDKLIFLTKESQEDFLSELKYPIEKSIVISHCVQNEATPLYINDNARKRRIVSLSRLASGKPIEDAVKAFALINKDFPDIQYDIYGVGPNAEALQKLILSLGLDKQVFLRGYTDNSLKEFANSLFSIMMSTQEGFGLTTLESSSVGCPVIVSDVKYGARDIIIDNKTGILVRPKNIKDIAKAMSKLLTDNSFRENMGKEAKNFVLQNFSRDSWQKKWLSIITD